MPSLDKKGTARSFSFFGRTSDGTIRGYIHHRSWAGARIKGAVIFRLQRNIADRMDPWLRMSAGMLGLLLGLYSTFYSLPLAVAFLLVGAWLLWDYLRAGGVWQAVAAFRRQDLDGVRYYLSQIQWGRYLSPQAKAYHEWMKGVLEAANGRYGAAQVHLLVAASGQLRSENDRSLVQCLLAEVAMQLNDPNAARQHLVFARELGHHDAVEQIIEGLSRRVAGML